MSRMQPTEFLLPSDLPRPVNDGAADHLLNMKMPRMPPALDGGANGRSCGFTWSENRDLLLSNDRCARKSAARRMGRNPGRARVYPTDLRFPGSSSRPVAASSRSIWDEHSDDRISARDGGS